MKDLIEALQIFLKYSDDEYPTYCDNHELFVNVNPEIVSDDDKKELERLGFYEDGDLNMFRSHKFGDY